MNSNIASRFAQRVNPNDLKEDSSLHARPFLFQDMLISGKTLPISRNVQL